MLDISSFIFQVILILKTSLSFIFLPIKLRRVLISVGITSSFALAFFYVFLIIFIPGKESFISVAISIFNYVLSISYKIIIGNLNRFLQDNEFSKINNEGKIEDDNLMI